MLFKALVHFALNFQRHIVNSVFQRGNLENMCQSTSSVVLRLKDIWGCLL